MDHKELESWKWSIELDQKAYEHTMTFSDNEKFGLVNQTRRSAVSVPSNIAEGAAQQGDKETIQFLHIALGSLPELETQLIIAGNLNYFVNSNILPQVDRFIRPGLGLFRYVRSK